MRLLLLKPAEAHLDLSQSSDGHLRGQDHRLGVGPTDLQHNKHRLQITSSSTCYHHRHNELQLGHSLVQSPCVRKGCHGNWVQFYFGKALELF